MEQQPTNIPVAQPNPFMQLSLLAFSGTHMMFARMSRAEQCKHRTMVTSPAVKKTATPLQHNSCHWHIYMQVLRWLFKVTFALCVPFSLTDSEASMFRSQPAVLRWRQPQEVEQAVEGKQKSKPSRCFGEERDAIKVEVTQWVEWTSLVGLSVSGTCGNRTCTTVSLRVAATQQVSSEHWGGNQRREGQQTLGLQDQVDRVSVSTHTSPSTTSLHWRKNNRLQSKLEESTLYWVLVFLLSEATGGVSSKLENWTLSKRRHKWW